MRDFLPVERGFSLLEFSATFLLTVPILLATLDISKILQAKSTTKAAVASALRCLSVTDDPTCSQALPSAPQPAYRVRLSTFSSQDVPLLSYEGEVKYLQGPSYDVGPFKAVILKNGFLEATGIADLLAEVPVFAVEADVSYQQLSEIRVPLIKNGTDRDPTFSGEYNRIDFSGTASAAKSSSGEPGSASYSTVFSLPNQYSLNNCLGSGSYTKSVNDSSCSGGKSGNKYVRAVIHVKGIGSSSKANPARIGKVCGRAELSLEQADMGSSDFDPYLNLTGQSFWGSAGNFVPRGYLASEQKYINPSVIPFKYPDGITTEAFQGEILLHPDKQYRIAVRTRLNKDTDPGHCIDGEVQYRITGGSAFLPKIEQVKKTVTCNETVKGCEKPALCTEASSQTLVGSKIDPAVFQSILSSAPRASASALASAEISCGVSLANSGQLATASQLALSPECRCADAKLKTSATKSILLGPIPCASTNYGVSNGLLSDGILTDSAEAQNICPISAPLISGTAIGEEQIKRWWQTTELELAPAIVVKPTDCSDSSKEVVIKNSWQANFPLYQKPLIEKTLLKIRPEINLIQSGKENQSFPAFDLNDPDNLIKTDNYSCPEFQVKTFKVHDLAKLNPGSSTIFDDLSPQLNCLGGDNPANWKTALAIELRQHYKDVEQAFFTPTYSVKGSLNLACGAEASYSTSLMANLCTPLKYFNATRTTSVLLPELITDNKIPSICNQPCTDCQLELVQINGSAEATVHTSIKKAELLALQQLDTFSPWLGRDCQESNCVNVSFETDQSVARGTAHIKVPLVSKTLARNLLGESFAGSKNYLEVSYQAERPMERMIAKAVNQPAPH